jgi:CxxC motif-containing protein (DUF1111 family)
MPKLENQFAASCAVLLACLAQACEAPEDVQNSELSSSAVSLDGLDAGERARFREGVGEFGEIESVAEGLGPFFNASSCGHCHAGAGLGSGGVTRVTRVMCRNADGELDAPPAGQLLHSFSTRPDVAGPGIPEGCDAIVADRRTTNVLGAGLIEAVDDQEILAEEAAQRDGVSGRAALVDDAFRGGQRVGRFGWKAQHATLDAFAADAYRNEMGITNEIFADEVAPDGDQEQLALMDSVPDPEAPVGAVAALADFMRFSAPLSPVKEEPAGLATFRQIGCTSCHRETYTTREGASGLAGRELRLYSDLLLHDLGTGDGIPQAAALDTEIRTPPLWGLGRSSLFLHDGSETSIDGAVLAHAGQATEARDAYAALSEGERLALLAFLEAL